LSLRVFGFEPLRSTINPSKFDLLKRDEPAIVVELANAYGVTDEALAEKADRVATKATRETDRAVVHDLERVIVKWIVDAQRLHDARRRNEDVGGAFDLDLRPSTLDLRPSTSFDLRRRPRPSTLGRPQLDFADIAALDRPGRGA
jgi:hypothetical protein